MSYSLNRKFLNTSYLFVILLGGWIVAGQPGIQRAAAQDLKASQAEERAIEHAEQMSLAFQFAIRKITPSVVNITSVEEVEVIELIFISTIS